MKNDYSLTLGIPTYNCEKTIEALITSAETMAILSNIKLTIIIVDDCSTDNTIKKINNMISLYDNIKLFINETNSGMPSKGRNKIIEEANTDFITFADCDDLIIGTAHKKCMEYLYNSYLNTAAFRVLLINRDNNDEYIRKFTNEDKIQIIKGKQILKLKRFSTVWNKVYKTDFVKDLKFKQTAGEDILFTYSTYNKQFEVVVIPSMGYIHYIQNSSLGASYKDNKELKQAQKKIRQEMIEKEFTNQELIECLV